MQIVHIHYMQNYMKGLQIINFIVLITFWGDKVRAGDTHAFKCLLHNLIVKHCL